MNYRRILGLFLFAALANGQSLDCITEMMIPRYNLSSRRSRAGGDVTAKITIGSVGRIAAIELEAADRDLADEVRAYLTNETQYSDRCQGKQVEIKFTFKLEGEPEVNPPVFIYFRPPNHFVIVSRPQKPFIN